MSAFVQQPNLPEHCAALVYSGKYADKLAKALELLDISSIFLPDNPDIDARLSGHADLSILHSGGNHLFLAPYLKGSALEAELQRMGVSICFPKITQREYYPRDAQLNLCIAGDHFIYNGKTAAREIVDYLTIRRHSRGILCRQGYSRCCVCVVDESSVITADRGIAASARDYGLDVLLIQPGYILLDGFDYGFIGGASFKIAADKLAFTGHLRYHPDADKILHFLDAHGVVPIYLTQHPAFDIGSAIPLLEN